MAAEGTPHEASIFATPLAWVTARVLAAPRTTVLAGVALALIGIVCSALGLGFRTSRLDLLNRESEWNQRWLAYLREFGDQDDAVVVVDGANAAAVTAAVDDLAAELARDERHFSSIFHRLELGRIRAKGLHLAPVDKLQELEAFVSQAEPVLRGDWQQLAVANQLRRLTFVLSRLPEGAPQRAAVSAQLARLTSSLKQATSESAEYVSPWPTSDTLSDDDARLNDQQLTADDGRLGFVMLKLVGKSAAAATHVQPVDHGPSLVCLRELMTQVAARHPQVTIGATGMPVLEHDEMQTSQRDMTWTSALSMVGVAACFWAAFGGWRHALLAMAALAISMCWAFGFVTMTIGHLNLLSVSFASVLIGQGVDFGVHYVSGYLRIRRESESCLAALFETSRTVGPGVFTGGLTTAVAFCMAALTDFTGLVELGLIAGSGILICTIGALVLLPPLIRWCDERRDLRELPTIVPMQFVTWPMHALPRLWLCLFLGVTAFCGVGLLKLRYDHNLLHLQSKHLASVDLEQTLLERADRSVWFALSMSPSRAELAARKAQFAALPTVSHTEEVISLLPEDEPLKTSAITNVRRVLALLPEQVPQLAAADVKDLRMVLRQTSQLIGQQPSKVQDDLQAIDNALAALPEAPAAALVSHYQQRTAEELVGRLQSLQAIADPLPPRLQDLPAPLAERYVGRTGQYLLKVYASGDVWDLDKLTHFVRDVESVDAQITGHPIQTFYASRQMQRSYLNAGVYAFIATFIAVVIDLRRVRFSLVAVLPMFFGLIQTFGILGWLDIPLNAANMIVLPLIFGIGIDDGVHLMHDFLHQKGRYRLDNATFVAVALTSVTTMVGFGSLILAQHQGLRSLGQVLTIGVCCCLISSTTFLPALFVLVTRKRPVEEASIAESVVTEEPVPAIQNLDSNMDQALAALREPQRTLPRRVA